MTTPTHDPQSRAFREATPADRWDGDLEALENSAQAWSHPPITSLARQVLPEMYERGGGWDEHRAGPKTITQAREALARRIEDPTAPDTAIEADAYTNLGRHRR